MGHIEGTIIFTCYLFVFLTILSLIFIKNLLNMKKNNNVYIRIIKSASQTLDTLSPSLASGALYA